VEFFNKPDVINEIANRARGENFFGSFFPIPEDATGILPGTKVWGTKWDISYIDISINYRDDNFIELQFDTAWSPPITFYEKFIDKYGGEIHATFCEPGCDFIGKFGPEGIQEWSLTDSNVPEILKETYEWIYESMEEENN
jgi:hypothetical protein